MTKLALADRKEIFQTSGLGAKIVALRNDLGISQGVLAAMAYLSQGHLSQIERGKVQNPSAIVLTNLALALGVNPTMLFTAAGYIEDLGLENGDGLRLEVNLELLALVADLPSLAQQSLCMLLWSFGGREPQEFFGPAKPDRFGRLVAAPGRVRKLGIQLRELRDQNEKTQGQLAAESGLSQGYLSQLESGEVKNPSAAVLLRIAKVLHVNADEIFEAAGYPTFRGIQDKQIALRARIIPDLYDLISGMTLEAQRRLLVNLGGIKSLFEERITNRTVSN